MLNIFWRSLPVEGKNLQFPANWNRRWNEADFAVARLILELAFDLESFSFCQQRAADRRKNSRDQRQVRVSSVRQQNLLRSIFCSSSLGIAGSSPRPAASARRYST